MKILFFSLILLLSGSAQAADRSGLKDKEKPEIKIVLTTAAPNFCLFGGQTGKTYHGEASFKAVVWRNDVIYVGESHDQPLAHLAQLEALKAMRIARGSRIVVGFEMLNQDLQPQLDDYVSGKTTEEEFLEAVNWKKEWGFDFGLYKPIFDLIRARKLKALALNVPRKVVGKIARTGLDSLTPEERRYLPEKVTITANKKYNDYLKATFGAHGGSPMAKMFTYENYLASMAAWNEGMGAKLASFLNENPGYSALVVAGNGHMMYNAAIPASVKSRTEDLRHVSFYTENAETCPEKMPKEHKNMANYLWYMRYAPKPEPAAAETPKPGTGTTAPENLPPPTANEQGRG